MHFAAPALELVLRPERDFRDGHGRGCKALRLRLHNGILVTAERHRKT
jgi:hypothetical protein